MTDRIGRYCDRCTKVDDHPRHTHANADGTTVDYHMDCCNCDICQKVLESADKKRGLELVDHIVGGGIDHLNPSAENAPKEETSQSSVSVSADVEN